MKLFNRKSKTGDPTDDPVGVVWVCPACGHKFDLGKLSWAELSEMLGVVWPCKSCGVVTP